MVGHVKFLGILHIVFGGLAVLAGIAVFAIFGGIAGLVGVAADPSDSWIAVPILGAIGTFVAGLAAVLGLPGLIAGFGLLGFRPWARILTIVLSAIELLNFPFGTILGAYGLWVLMTPATERLFTAQSYRTV